jgi:hypothetical protein
VLVEAGYDPDDVLTVVGLPAMGFKEPEKPGALPPGAKPPAALPPGQTKTPDQQPESPSTNPKPAEPTTIHDFADIATIMREAFTKAKTNGNGHKVGRL